MQPAAGLKLRGDIGLLFGDDSGTNTAQRVHWVDRETNVVNDTPTEAEFFPDRWGTWELLGADGKKSANVEPASAPNKTMSLKASATAEVRPIEGCGAVIDSIRTERS